MKWSRAAQRTPSAEEKKSEQEDESSHETRNHSESDEAQSTGLETVLPEKTVQLEPKDEPSPNININDTDDKQYPGFKVVLLTSLSICLVVFLVALVSPPTKPLPRTTHLTNHPLPRTEPSSASPSPRSQTNSTPSTKYPGMSPVTSSPLVHSSCQWERYMLVASSPFTRPFAKVYRNRPSSPPKTPS